MNSSEMPLEKGRVFIPAETLTDPCSGPCESLRNHWWVTNAKGELLFYRENSGRSKRFFTPQANSDRRICAFLCTRFYSDLEIRQVPSVFVKINQNGSMPIPEEYR